MEKLAVKKPFTILVAVVVIIALGAVSLSQMSMDLLPEMNLPNLMVIVPYPGANPEKVAADVTGPLENALGVVKNVENVQSTSAENYAMISLAFTKDTNMDSATVNVSSALNQVSSRFPNGVGTPTMLQIGMDIFATLYVGVAREGDDIYSLSTYVEDTVIPAFQKLNGVANVTAVGMVEKTVQVELNREKIDALNERILERADNALLEAREALDEAKAQVERGQQELERQQAGFGTMLAGTLFGRLDEPVEDLKARLLTGVDDLTVRLDQVETELELEGESEDVALLRRAAEELDTLLADLETEMADTQELSQRAEQLLSKLEKAISDVTDAFYKELNDSLRASGVDREAARRTLEQYLSSARGLVESLSSLIGALRKEANNAGIQAALAAVNAALPEARRSFRAARDSLLVLRAAWEAAGPAAGEAWEAAGGLQDADAAEKALSEAYATMQDLIQTVQREITENESLDSDLTELRERLLAMETEVEESIAEALRQRQAQADSAVGAMENFRTAGEALRQALSDLRNGDFSAGMRLPSALSSFLTAARELRLVLETGLRSLNGAAKESGVPEQADTVRADLEEAIRSLDSLIPTVEALITGGQEVAQAAGPLLEDLEITGQAAEKAFAAYLAERNVSYQTILAAGQSFTQACAQLLQALELYGQAVYGVLDSAAVRAAFSRLQSSANAMLDVVQRSGGSLLAYLGALSSAFRAAENREWEVTRNFRLREELNALTAELRALADRLTGATLGDLMTLTGTFREIVDRAQTLMDSIDLPAAGEQAQNLLDQAKDRAMEALSTVRTESDRIPELLDNLEMAYSGLTQGQLDAAVAFSLASQQLTAAQAQLGSAFDQYEDAREKALSSANLDTLVDASTLSGLIYAQNFAMPAGYLDDRDSNAWLLRVGSEYDSEQDIAGTLLTDIDGIGAVRISDIADITVIDNALDSYSNLNGNDGIMVCVYKSSTAGTNDVSRACDGAIRELTEADENLRMLKLMDQGSYITLLINGILESMLVGAALAILVLALFLKDVRPTLIVAVSIPLSVLFALVLMYFTGLTLNMMTMAGLGLGIGMLVDNSIVVLENIVRLKNRGMSASRAAAQGTRQVNGAILASTLTTVSVFLPMAFASGTVREMLIPLSLSVSYCLVASLLVAMTVIPAASSTLLSRVEPKTNRTMERLQRSYGKALRWMLGHKAVVLAVSIGLFAFMGYRLYIAGFVVMPKMDTQNLSYQILTDPELEREESYALMGQVLEQISSVEGAEQVGIMDTASIMGTLGGMGTGSGGYGDYNCFVSLPENFGSKQIRAVREEVEAKISAIGGCELRSGMLGMNMSALTASGLSATIYGQDEKTLMALAGQVAETAATIEGFTDITDGSEDTIAVLHLVIDKDKAMSYGLTVAQIYAQIAGRMVTSVTGTSISANGFQMDVTVHSDMKPVTRENLLDMEFTAASLGSSGDLSSVMGGASSGMGGNLSSMMGGDLSSMMGSGMSALMEQFMASQARNGSQADPPAADGGETAESKTHKLREFAHIEETVAPSSILRENLTRYITVDASVEDGYNATKLTTELERRLEPVLDELPDGYSILLKGEREDVYDMLESIVPLGALGLLFIYLVMVAQFQSLLSPFIIMFTLPLAFTGGMLALVIAGQQINIFSLIGFLILMGTVVNNGIVFVDYTNQLRLGGLGKWDALIATGQARMRPILMTTLTTVLAMVQMAFGDDPSSQMASGMAIVIIGGLVYATLMTLFVVPVMYDILYRGKPRIVDVGDDINDVPDDAAEYLAQLRAAGEVPVEEYAQNAGEEKHPE